jgi:hypothetical protein
MTSDMPANFLSHSGELCNKMYNHHLVLEEPIDPWYGNYGLVLNVNLVCANKMIHREASSLLYAQNRFIFTGCDSELIARFLNKIGRNNANHIQYICIDFPNVRDLEGAVILGDDSVGILERSKKTALT